MTTPTVNQLRLAVAGMDTTSQGAFTQIATIAKLALAFLETPLAYTDPESIAVALSTILDKAVSAENTINSIAEEVGANFKDPAFTRRIQARIEAAAEGGSNHG